MNWRALFRGASAMVVRKTRSIVLAAFELFSRKLSSPMDKVGWVYILSSGNGNVLYVGVTNNLSTRVWEHRTKRNRKSFTARYNVFNLVYYERFECIMDAIEREKYINGKTRAWKDMLIDSMNPEWIDLYDSIENLSNACCRKYRRWRDEVFVDQRGQANN